MAFRAELIFLLVALAAVAAGAYSSEHGMYYGLGSGDGGQGLVGEAMDQLDPEQMMESDSARRLLASTQAGYVSYGALSRNKVPCDQRGQSYYNCRSHERANPYTRGCTRVTYCVRNNR